MLNDFRLTNPVNDCADLLDVSSDELTMSLDVADSVKSNGHRNGTGHPGSDMKAWLSAAVGNQDTSCLDGFHGTKGVVETLVAGIVQGVVSVVADVLRMVRNILAGCMLLGHHLRGLEYRMELMQLLALSGVSESDARDDKDVS
ncbi:hypothetical protein AAC387_Pa03g4268 [Persea americana]